MTALWFFIGLMVGGTVGVVLMCCFQIGKDGDTHLEERTKKEK